MQRVLDDVYGTRRPLEQLVDDMLVRIEYEYGL